MTHPSVDQTPGSAKIDILDLDFCPGALPYELSDQIPGNCAPGGNALACNCPSIYLVASTDQSCILYDNIGEWNDNFTAWRLEDPGSIGRLADFLSLPDQRNNNSDYIGSPKHVLVLGDSTMAKLARYLLWSEIHGNRIYTRLKNANRCALMEYYGLSRAVSWIPPDFTKEGRRANRLNHSFCTDCAACEANMRTYYDDTSYQLERTYDFIPVEFARDREMQTEGTRTSQETLVRYLKSTLRRDLCVASAGIHDVILGNLSSAQYTKNVLEYIRLLKLSCKRTIWLQTTASLNRKPQVNDVLLERNHLLAQSCTRTGNDVVLFNTWNFHFQQCCTSITSTIILCIIKSWGNFFCDLVCSWHPPSHDGALGDTACDLAGAEPYRVLCRRGPKTIFPLDRWRSKHFEPHRSPRVGPADPHRQVYTSVFQLSQEGSAHA